MKPEILENVLYYYVEGKHAHDEVDSPIAEANVSPDKYVLQPHLGSSSASAEDYLFTPTSPIVFEPAQLSAEQKLRVRKFGRTLAEMTDKFCTVQPDKGPVKFKSSCLFVPPNQQTISIAILRQNSHKTIPLKIKWKTRDRTAVAGTHYIGSSGEFTFKENENDHEIQICVLPFETNANNLRFQVELSIENSAYEPKPLTVSFEDISKFENDERDVVNCLLRLSPSSIPDVYNVVQKKLSPRTFHSALTYLCTEADHLNLEFGLALELSRLCLPNLTYEKVFNILNDFFRADDVDL